MLQIENGTVVSGSIVGDDLILETRGGSQINAGDVRGPQGIQGIPGPPGEVTQAQLDAINAALTNADSVLTGSVNALDVRVTELESVRACRASLGNVTNDYAMNVGTVAAIIPILAAGQYEVPEEDFTINTAGHITVTHAGVYEIIANITYNISAGTPATFVRAQLQNFDTATSIMSALGAGGVGYHNITLPMIISLAAGARINAAIGAPSGTSGGTVYQGVITVKRL
jgi:hypothetical protein